MRRSIDALALSAMVLICLVLGFQQVALKSVASDMAPVLQLAVRSAIAAFLVCSLMFVRSHSFSIKDGTLRPGLLLGCLFTLEFFCLGEGLQYTHASRIVVFLYSAPVFTAVVLHFCYREERLSAVQWGGILLAFIGMGYTYLSRTPDGSVSMIDLRWGDTLGLIAGLAWGLSTVLVRTTSLAKTEATKTLLYQLVVATALLVISAVLMRQTEIVWTPRLVGNLIFQGVFVSFFSFLAWFALLRRYVASELGVLTFMSPIFGVAFGIAILNEPLDVSFIVGALLVLIGIVLVTAYPLYTRRRLNH